MRFTVLICTHNRRDYLADTLAVLSEVRTAQSWEVIVVDNNSTDGTRDLVRAAAATFPVDLRYVFEETLGKYAALNTGIRAARGEIIAATDDDARVDPLWLDRAAAALEQYRCDFVGGPVTPLWEGPPPDWLDATRPLVQKVIAILDYGDAGREFGVGIGWPLGVNVAYRREVFQRVGFFDPALGRKAGTLRSQSQREWHLRARAAGIRGFYTPDMRVQHRVVTTRLKRGYFRWWYYWHGISRGTLYYRRGFDIEEPERMQYDRPLPEFLGVPLRLWVKAFYMLRSYAWRSLRGQGKSSFEYELWLCFFAGVIVQCRRERRSGFREARQADPAMV
jgi:glycosyltransferase involved in cell wall biosynthesis